MNSSRTKIFLAIFFLAMAITKSQDRSGDDKKGFKMTVRNELATDVTLWWEGGEKRHKVDLVKSHGGEKTFDTFPGHLFSYVFEGEVHFVEIPVDAKERFGFAVLNAREEDIIVRCSTTAKGRTDLERWIDFHVRPQWAPRGAARFLSIIRNKHYNGVAIHRVVKNELTQFGIPVNPKTRNKLSSFNIKDDRNIGIPFVPGILSFTGSGKNSRTAEVFVVMPNCTHLSSFGKESWETPFGFVGKFEESVVTDWYDGYGDKPPNGYGPDPQKIYAADGYEYLKEEFPMMDYINSCVIIREHGSDEL